MRFDDGAKLLLRLGIMPLALPSTPDNHRFVIKANLALLKQSSQALFDRLRRL